MTIKIYFKNFLEKLKEMERNAEKCMEWNTEISGAPHVSGKRHVKDSPTDEVANALFQNKL